MPELNVCPAPHTRYPLNVTFLQKYVHFALSLASPLSFFFPLSLSLSLALSLSLSLSLSLNVSLFVFLASHA